MIKLLERQKWKLVYNLAHFLYPHDRQGQWSIVPSGCLTRRFNGNTPDAVAVEEVLRTPASNFVNFEMALRINLHDNVHCLIDGTMCSLNSAAAPEFFLHHGFIDKIWADWQKRSSAHKNAFFPGINERLIGTPYYPKQLVNLAAQPGGVRVEYRNLRRYNNVYGYLKGEFSSLVFIDTRHFSCCQTLPRLGGWPCCCCCC